MSAAHRVVGVLAATALALAGCEEPEGEALRRSAAFDAAVDGFFEVYREFHPTTAASAGLHEYDPLLGRRDALTIETYVEDLRRLEATFEALDPTGLAPGQRLDRELILRQIRGDLFWLDDVGTWRRNPRTYTGQLDFTLLLQLEYAPLAERMASIVSRLEQIPALVEAARANVTDPPAPFVETALVGYRNLPDFLRTDLTAALAEAEDEALQRRFRAARDSAAAALERYAAHLADVQPAAAGYALGPERWRRMNALLAGIDLSEERLEEVARTELARLQALADSLAGVIAPGRGVAAAFAALGEDSPEPDAIVSTAAAEIGELREFVDGRLGTVRPGEVEVLEIPPYRRTNFAYIIIPGPFERIDRGFYFVHPVEPSWSQAVRREFLRKNNRWILLNTSVHEAYPGHYHHYNHIRRAPTPTQRLLTAYVTTEGWAHYAEEVTWREGLEGGDPRLGLAVVQDALLRVVRFLSSIGLHTRGMTVEESEGMFRALAFQDSVNARQQALRGTYDPEYLNYTLGKLVIREIRVELEARRGTSFDLAAFHDEFMAAGAPPVVWIGRRLLGDPEWTPFQ